MTACLEMVFLPLYKLMMEYFINAALDGLDGNHEYAVVDEDEIGDDDGACALNISEVSDGRVDGVEGISADIEGKVVKREAFDAACDECYDLSL